MLLGCVLKHLDPTIPEVCMGICLDGRGFRQLLPRCLGRTTAYSSHPTSHLQLWVGHRVPKVWLILVNVDEAGICGAVEYHLRHTEKHSHVKHLTGPYPLQLSSRAHSNHSGPSQPSLFLSPCLGVHHKIAEKRLQGIGVCHETFRSDLVKNVLG